MVAFAAAHSPAAPSIVDFGDLVNGFWSPPRRLVKRLGDQGPVRRYSCQAFAESPRENAQFGGPGGKRLPAASEFQDVGMGDVLLAGAGIAPKDVPGPEAEPPVAETKDRPGLERLADIGGEGPEGSPPATAEPRPAGPHCVSAQQAIPAIIQLPVPFRGIWHASPPARATGIEPATTGSTGR